MEFKLGCEYHGTVRGAPSSWVSVTACAGAGIQGTIHHGRDSFYIEPALTANGSMESTHYLYNEQNRNHGGVCGNSNNQFKGNLIRQHRSAQGDIMLDPYNVNISTLYNELLLVVDQSTFIHLGGDLENVYTYCKRLTMHLNYLYLPLNIYIVLVEIIVWKNGDEIIITENSLQTLNNFRGHRKNELFNRIPHDNAHLITRQKFERSDAGEVVGLADVGGICTKFASAVNSLTDDVEHSATILAHEMGHNFGMGHDVPSCSSRPNACIMNSFTSHPEPDRWSECSKSVITTNIARYRCLRNKPTKLHVSATCGNGILESGEECDCGPLAGACANCCEVSTCRLRQNSTCASGACCNKQTCSIMGAGIECRDLRGECDLPEYCDGDSEHCPQDVTKMDSESCADGRAFCYEGSCQLNTDVTLCRQFWGPYANSGRRYCDRHIRNGQQYLRDDSKSKFRTSDYKYCGSLMCHLMENVKSGWNVRKSGDDVQGYCYQLMEESVAMVVNGLTCGEGKMCVDQNCVAVREFQEQFRLSRGSVCPSNCSGHGVCNSKGECHCDNGYAPPTCIEPGTGGSNSSGSRYRSEKNEPLQPIQIAIYVVFLGIIPFVIIVIIIIKYTRLRENDALKMCVCWTPNSKSGTLLNRISQLPVNLSKRMASKASVNENKMHVSKGVSKSNTQSVTTTLSNMSPAEITLIKALTSNLKPTSSSNPERILKETFHCDFRAAFHAYKKNEKNFASIGQGTHGSSNIERTSVICHTPPKDVKIQVVNNKLNTLMQHKSDESSKTSTMVNASNCISPKINKNEIITNEGINPFTRIVNPVSPVMLGNPPKSKAERDSVAPQNKSALLTISKNSMQRIELKNTFPENNNYSQSLLHTSKTLDSKKIIINNNGMDKLKPNGILHSSNNSIGKKPTGLASTNDKSINKLKPSGFESSNNNTTKQRKPTELISTNDNSINKQKLSGFPISNDNTIKQRKPTELISTNDNSINKQKLSGFPISNDNTIGQRKPTGLISTNDDSINKQKLNGFPTSNDNNTIGQRKPTGLISKNDNSIDKRKLSEFASSGDNTTCKRKPTGFSSNTSEAEFITKLNSLKSVTK